LSAFYNCTSLSYVSLPEYNLTNLGEIFPGCSDLRQLTIGTSQITSMKYGFGLDYSNIYKRLSIINLPACSLIEGYGTYGPFYYMSSRITQLSLPECRYIGYNGLSYLSLIQTLSLPKCSYLGSYALCNMYNLSRLYLLNSSVVDIHKWAFSPYSCRLFSATSTIYVPSSLYSSYVARYTSLSTRFARY